MSQRCCCIQQTSGSHPYLSNTHLRLKKRRSYLWTLFSIERATGKNSMFYLNLEKNFISGKVSEKFENSWKFLDITRHMKRLRNVPLEIIDRLTTVINPAILFVGCGVHISKLSRRRLVYPVELCVNGCDLPFFVFVCCSWFLMSVSFHFNYTWFVIFWLVHFSLFSIFPI